MRKYLAALVLPVLLAGCGSGDPTVPDPGHWERLAGELRAKQNRPIHPAEFADWAITARRAVFSPDNRYVLITYFSRKDRLADLIPVYDLTTGKRVHTFSTQDLYDFVAIPGTGHLLAVNRNWETSVWDMTTGKRLCDRPKFPHGAYPFSRIISRDGRRVVIGWEEVRQPRDEQARQPEVKETVEEVWDLKNGKPIQRWTTEYGIGPGRFSPDGKWLFVRDNQKRKYVVLDVITGKVLREEKWPAWQDPLAFSRDGKLAVSEGGDGKKPQMFLWNWTTGKIVKKLDFQAKGPYPGHYDPTAVAFSSDGKQLISGGADLALRCWDIASGKEIWALDITQGVHPRDGIQPSLWVIAFSPDGTRALTGAGAWVEAPGGTKCLRLRVWDCTNGALLRELPPVPEGRGE